MSGEFPPCFRSEEHRPLQLYFLWHPRHTAPPYKSANTGSRSFPAIDNRRIPKISGSYPIRFIPSRGFGLPLDGYSIFKVQRGIFRHLTPQERVSGRILDPVSKTPPQLVGIEIGYFFAFFRKIFIFQKYPSNW